MCWSSSYPPNRLVTRIDNLERVVAMPNVDRRALRADLKRRVDEWREPLRANVPQARQLLRKVLANRLTLTPEGSADRYSTITGEGTLTKILAGIVSPKGMASPAGFETCRLRAHRMVRVA